MNNKKIQEEKKGEGQCLIRTRNHFGVRSVNIFAMLIWVEKVSVTSIITALGMVALRARDLRRKGD